MKRKNCSPEVWTLIKEAMTFYHNHDVGQGPCMKCLAKAALQSVSRA